MNKQDFEGNKPIEAADKQTYFTTKGLSDYLLIPEQSLRRWVLNNEIPYCRIHGVIRYRLSEIEKWIDKNKEKLMPFMTKKQENELFSETDNAEAETANLEELEVCETAESGETK
jgi:hypothetical protein